MQLNIYDTRSKMLGGEFFLFLGILLVSLSRIIGDCPYAKFSPEHTACLPPNPTCNIIRRGVTDQDKEHIVKLHNQYRSKIATGQETRGGGMPQAANMMELVWDDELAKLAQLHAEQCEVEHECNECRQVDRFPVGQNLFYSGDNMLPTHFDWDSIMEVFYDEVSYFNSGDIKPYVFDEPYAHFTQLVWGPSQYVGCGSIIANASGFYNTIYVCDFGIAGNDIGGEMYRVGSTCSACPANASSCTVSGQDSYEGLCRASKTMSSSQITMSTLVSSKAPTPRNIKVPAPPSTKAPTQPKQGIPAQIIYDTPEDLHYEALSHTTIVSSKAPAPTNTKVPAPPSTKAPTQPKQGIPAQIIYDTPEELPYEAPSHTTMSTIVSSKVSAPPSTKEPTQPKHGTPAQIIYETPAELHYEAPDQMYYEALGHYYEALGHYYEAPGHYYEAPGNYYEVPGHYYEAPSQYYETQDQYYETQDQYYENPGQVYSEGQGKMTYGIPEFLGNMYQVQYW